MGESDRAFVLTCRLEGVPGEVRLEAVDVGPAEADAWLAANGVRYGVCQIYETEPWHFELRPSAIDAGCPPMYNNPTEDPRMRE